MNPLSTADKLVLSFIRKTSKEEIADWQVDWLILKLEIYIHDKDISNFDSLNRRQAAADAASQSGLTGGGL